MLRRIPGMLVPMLAFLGLGVAGVLHREQTKDVDVARRIGEGVVQLQANAIEREVELVAAFLSTLAEDASVVEVASRASASAEAGADLVRLVGATSLFSRARLLDGRGREIVDIRMVDGSPRAVDDVHLQEEHDRYYFVNAWTLGPGDVQVSSFTLARDDYRLARPWRPILKFVTAVAGPDHEKLALLEVEYAGANLLERVRRAGERVGWSALVNERGYFIESPDGESSWGFLLGMPPTFAARNGDAWERFQTTTAGSVLTGDGLFVHRAVSRAPHPRIARSEFDVSAVAFLPPDLVYQASNNTRRILIFGAVLVGLALTALAWRIAFAGAVRSNFERQLAVSRRDLRLLSRRLMDAQEEERKSLSRDLHDELGQQATALVIELKRAARSTPARDDESLDRAIRAGEALVDSLHSIATRLRSDVLEDLGFVSALEALGSDFQERFQVTTLVELWVDDEDVDDAVARNVYRIVQEALTNVFKHARASEVRVEVRDVAGELVVTITDDGIGFDTTRASTGRLGLVGMRERVAQVGGTLRWSSSPDRGTRIEARIPLRGSVSEGNS